LRQRQLHSISEQLAIARGKQTSLARMIEKLDAEHEWAIAIASTASGF